MWKLSKLKFLKLSLHSLHRYSSSCNFLSITELVFCFPRWEDSVWYCSNIMFLKPLSHSLHLYLPSFFTYFLFIFPSPQCSCSSIPSHFSRLSPRLPWWILTYRSRYANIPKYCGNELILHSTYRFWNLFFIVESDDFIWKNTSFWFQICFCLK